MSKLRKELVKFSYKKIPQRIAEAGLTKKTVCEKAGVLNYEMLKAIIKGKINPRASEFLKIHNVLRCSMRDMVDLDVEYRDTIEVIYLDGTRLSYRPLRDFLESYGMTVIEALQDELSKVTLTKLNNDRDVNMKTIAIICKYLRIPPDKVMRLE